MAYPPERQRLLAEIDELLQESYQLPRTRASFERRQEIEWELVQLFRQIAELSGGSPPYWADDETKSA